jgi:hypothetical protein
MGIVERIEYDPNRSSRIAPVLFFSTNMKERKMLIFGAIFKYLARLLISLLYMKMWCLVLNGDAHALYNSISFFEIYLFFNELPPQESGSPAGSDEQESRHQGEGSSHLPSERESIIDLNVPYPEPRVLLDALHAEVCHVEQNIDRLLQEIQLCPEKAKARLDLLLRLGEFLDGVNEREDFLAALQNDRDLAQKAASARLREEFQSIQEAESQLKAEISAKRAQLRSNVNTAALEQFELDRIRQSERRSQGSWD